MVLLRRLLAGSLALLPFASAATTTASKCGTDDCLQAVRLFPGISGAVSTFCQQYIHSTPCTTKKTTTVTSTARITGSPQTVDVTSITTLTVTGPSTTVTQSSAVTVTQTGTPSTTGVTLTTTVTTINSVLLPCTFFTIETVSALTTTVDYVSRPPGTPAKRDLDERALPSSLIRVINSGCNSKSTPLTARLSSACSCYLGKATAPTTTKTVTTTSSVRGTTKTTTAIATVTTSKPGTTLSTVVGNTVTVFTPGPTVTTTVIETDHELSYLTTCGPTISTVTSVVFAATAFTCGNTFTSVPAASTSGDVTCANSVATPSANALFRIEGLQSGEGTIFEGCVVSGPRDVTTPSGGTHLCDGTNNGANLAPGTTPTDLIDAAARQNGFGFDGPWASQYSDFFITSISETAQTASQFWGVLSDLAFTPNGGCEFEIDQGSATQWIFDAFSYRSFLSVSPGYAVAEAGNGVVTVTISAVDGNGGNASPAVGATFAGASSDGSGRVTISVPQSPGCYQYKAFQNGAAPSNAFYLTVFPQGVLSSQA